METTDNYVEYNPVTMLELIRGNKQMNNMLSRKTELGINMLITMVNNDTLSEDLDKYLKELFLKVVVTQGHLTSQYNEIKTKPTKKIKTKFYGKKRLLQEIEDLGGKVTDTHRMLLALNDLNNLYERLRRKGAAKLDGEDLISDTECRAVISSIKILTDKCEKMFG